MLFAYMCRMCREGFTQSHRAGQAPESPVCEHCGSTDTHRDYRAEGNKVNAEQVKSGQQYPYASRRLPRGLEGCPTDSEGRTVIQSPRHEREVMARHGYERE